MANAPKGMEIVKAADRGLIALDPSDDLAEILAESLAGEEVGLGDLERVKWPTGGATSFMRTTLGNEEFTKEIEGVIVFQRMGRAFWTNPEPVEGTEPDCRSTDGIWGVGTPGDQLRQQTPPLGCKHCPKSQFGSARDKSGGAKRGQACKLMRDLFIITAGSTFPLIVSIPPASLGEVRSFLVEMASSGIRYYEVVVSLSLVKATSKDGQAYAEAALRLVGRLDPESTESVRGYRERMVPSFEQVPTVAETPADDDAPDDE